MDTEIAQGGAHEAARKEGQPEPTRNRALFRPLTDIHETDKAVVMTVEMPGVTAESVEIMLEKRVLTLRGRNEAAARPEGYRPIYAEYDEGDYERVFTLSEDIDDSQIRAAIRDGVLILELPKAEPARPRRIDVKSN
jgi:HSP20 family molecular chaperone IbpA